MYEDDEDTKLDALEHDLYTAKRALELAAKECSDSRVQTARFLVATVLEEMGR